MFPYPHLRAFLLLSGALCLPFALKLSAPALELYPAILLPAGAGTASTDQDVLEITRRELYGIEAKTGQAVRLDPIRFLDPIPVHYFSTLFGDSFGMAPPEPVPIAFRKIGSFHLQPRVFSKEKINFEFDGKKLRFTVPKVEIYEGVEIIF